MRLLLFSNKPSFRIVYSWKIHNKCCSFFFFTLHLYPASVFFYHTFHYSQADSGSFPLFFRCKKRFKHMLSKIFWNTAAIIFYYKPYRLVIIYT